MLGETSADERQAANILELHAEERKAGEEDADKVVDRDADKGDDLSEFFKSFK